MSKEKTEIYNLLKDDTDFMQVYFNAFKTTKGYKTRLKYCINNCLSKDIKQAYILDRPYIDISHYTSENGTIFNLDEIYFSFKDYFI